MNRIFISYRRQDTEGYVGRLYDHLIQHFNAQDVFMDVSSIPPGEDFVTFLENAVAGCDVCIAMIGPSWLTITDTDGSIRLENPYDFVRIEIASALKQGKFVIPVLVGGARMPGPHQLVDDLIPLARRNAIELSHHRFAYDVTKLIDAIRNAIPSRSKPGTSSEIVREKEEKIKAVRLDLVSATNSPLYNHRVENRYFPVIGEGNADANILFIGESPGRMEAESGRPFCGPSGEVLDEMLRGIRLKREDVFMTNVLLDRPPDNRDPIPAEIDFYAPFLDRLIDIIQPAVLVSLGRWSMQYILKKFELPEKRQKISELHGKLIKATAPYGEIHIVPLYHPAVVLYSATQKETLRKDFEKLKLFI